jgi:hypothetical protein
MITVASAVAAEPSSTTANVITSPAAKAVTEGTDAGPSNVPDDTVGSADDDVNKVTAVEPAAGVFSTSNTTDPEVDAVPTLPRALFTVTGYGATHRPAFAPEVSEPTNPTVTCPKFATSMLADTWAFICAAVTVCPVVQVIVVLNDI